jgi:hypothetical protein
MNKFLKYFLIGLGVFIGIIVLLNIVIPKPKMSDTSDIENKIKALDRINLELIKKQTVLDSVDAEYRARIEDIETRLMDIGQSKIIVQKIYSDRIQKSKQSTPSDLDTFFRDRYKY